MAEKRPDYLSYLLRMWRASLQHVETGERVSFRSLDELFAFLRRQGGTMPDAEEHLG